MTPPDPLLIRAACDLVAAACTSAVLMLARDHPTEALRYALMRDEVTGVTTGGSETTPTRTTPPPD